jgi:hypothetical protein
MRLSIGVLPVIALLCVGTLEGQELRSDSFKWYIGFNGGGVLAQTQLQDYKTLPSAGAHILVVGKRGGVMVSVEESFGDNEQSAFAFTYARVIETVVNGETVEDTVLAFPVHGASFDRIRKYSAMMMAFPIKAKLEPYLGVGFGLMHTVGTELVTPVPDPQEGFKADSVMSVRNSSGFGSFVGGVQYGAGSPVVVFGQYQVSTAPAGGNLLTGPTHSFQFGLRLRLGRAKEDIKGGGY